ncbi:MAG: DedA family protein [Planctomycetes bacterium]|nr:DedA family protein [Planctomycetota bacterium]
MTTSAPPAAPPPPQRRGPLRRLYDWVLHWANTPFAVPALVLLAFAESSFFPIPPDVLLIALCIGEVPKSYRFAGWCSLGSVLGGMAGYAIGAFFWHVDAVREFFYLIPGINDANVQKVSAWYEQYNFWIVFVAAFTPIPYKVITILAGVCGIALPMFVLASAVGRSARFFLVAWLFRHFGPPIKDFIERRFALVTFAGALLLVGGFVAIKYVM